MVSDSCFPLVSPDLFSFLAFVLAGFLVLPLSVIACLIIRCRCVWESVLAEKTLWKKITSSIPSDLMRFNKPLLK